jgi:uncharacterized membrane protein
VNAELLVLRLVHIVGGMFWVGTALFMTFFLLPAATQAGPSGGQVMANLAKRKIMVVLPIVAILTILSGIRLMHIVSAGFAPGYFRTGSGHTYAISAACAVLALIIGIAVSRPAHLKAAKLSQSAVSDKSSKELINAEIKALHQRANMASMIVTILVLLAAAGMAIARYM